MSIRVYHKKDAPGMFDHDLSVASIKSFLLHAPIGLIAGLLPMLAAFDFDARHVAAACFSSFMLMVTFLVYQIYEGIRIQDFSFVEIGEALTGMFIGLVIVLLIVLI